MIQATDIACLIFASGASSRFGSSKMLYPLGDSRAVLAKTIQIYTQVFDVVNVVVSDKDPLIIKLVQCEAAVPILNQYAELGLSQSLIAGVESTEPTTGWLCALGDMPYLSVKTVKSISEHLSPNNIVVPRTELGNGNPVGLGINFREELLSLKGDVGAKPLIKRHANSINYLDCNDPNIHRDIDRPSDIF